MRQLRSTLTRIAFASLCGVAVAVALAAAAGSPARAEATKVRVVLDWAWLPYHSPFLIAQDKGYYKDAGLDVTIEQGRGSANTAVLVSQGQFDIGHLNITNAAQMIGKGGPMTVVGIYQHKSGASFVGIKGKVALDGPKSLIGPKIGSTPGGSDALSIKIFTKVSGLKASDLDIVSLDANAKTAALLSGKIDVVSGDAPAYTSYVKATGQEPVALILSDYGLPLVGFGFGVNNDFLAKHPDAVKKFLAATKKGFQDAAADPAKACAFMAETVHLSGEQSRCVNYFNALLALSTPPSDPTWGKQSAEEWQKLTDTLREVGLLESDKPASTYYSNEFVPQ
ncbi:NitT/TauT family transport system substrate-binding protein [Tistlia consotensis]|uniref:Thiamine pyrimidine synthase n=1 Tax=Tistlia consotensis USBA 355 TaxID=560819 RepID=A0A1Y6CSI5_9PROT|nr:ABC transporter substrate-binding protein [Tistlia consotensis]SMF70556.1 NitT/TauT family transport system substrate-binding protein [Tistlia consotensis USBA 355]SNS04851.1 NitT/TauT family transport system substrate-binding protein [Tistlia consotensis]